MTDTVPDRAEITAALSAQWDELTRLVDGLDETAWRTPSALPGWTVFDVIAHVIGVESLLLGEPTPEVEVSGEHIRNDVGALNEKWIAALRPLTGVQLLERFREITGRRLKALAETGPEVWAEPVPTPVGMAPYGRFMRIRLFDCWMHGLDIADGLGVNTDEGGPRAENAFPELLPAIGKAVVKGAGAPDGASVTIETTGPVRHTVHVAVAGGRAAVVENLDAPATVALSLPSGLFARLRGGRTGADAHPGEYAITGDTELGERLVRSLAFTL
ncbi:maleylpyruvate isomerase family mycothiol-dependent enzyme [Nocardia huaxiensis]|uniref:Maleylpyruvate isomerase family mycothiol-dependent enzyme n=1 Tax=Nocardia huaxiensis TaxID=2755382 RepID=A0A7D6ZPB7_9NOCA|nr:maleylpyruvate isomerase family mycothiol-dependent enzyme [Nocardia huaxiensis]QLY32083.1 maleylpyruvate isomerase family mycothiol-dependent enzyme [Nocardia huaxiensis]UFS95662.1 maleylpyruvate isomerase family mycothiol-dependent enzyme [Nocardia huaxiensis]